MEGNRPVYSCRDGKMEISLWKSGSEGNRMNARLRKSYKDKNNEWMDQTVSLFDSDIPRCILLLEEAYREILCRKREKVN